MAAPMRQTSAILFKSVLLPWEGAEICHSKSLNGYSVVREAGVAATRSEGLQVARIA